MVLTITPEAAIVLIAFAISTYTAQHTIKKHKAEAEAREKAMKRAARKDKKRQQEQQQVIITEQPEYTYPTYRTVSHLGHRTLKEGKHDY